MNYRFLYHFVISIVFWIGFSACENENIGEPMPYVQIYKVLDLNNLSYFKLKNDRGWVYEDGGVRGLIIYRQSSSSYLVFERACTHKPINSCAKVEVDGSGFFMQDLCCKSQFDFNGNVIGGIAPRPLVQYRSSLSGSLLYISN